MSASINTKLFLQDGSEKFKIKNCETKVKDFYTDDFDYERLITQCRIKIDALQSKMYAHNKFGLVIIFQAIDAAGKDSTIKHVMSGINPHGVKVFAFKRPSETELEHDYLWRTNQNLPERGTIAIYNRSYYEEVLVVKVHPEIIKNYQKIPFEYIEDLEKVWEKRYDDISNTEKYLTRNGIHVLKIFLHVSKKEQGLRLKERIMDPTKNWKFEEGDIKERTFWDEYMSAYEDCINATATEKSPWYIIPADDKKNMRLIVSQIIQEKLESLPIEYPKLDATQQAELHKFIEIINEQDKGL